MTRPSVPEQGGLYFAVAQVIPRRIHHDYMSQNDIHIRVRCKKLANGFQSVGQVLFVAVEATADFPGGTAEPSIQRVIHPAVGFHKGSDAWILWQPVQRAISRAGVLNDVLQLHLLICNGSYAEFQPRRMLVAGRNDGNQRQGHGGVAMLLATGEDLELEAFTIGIHGRNAAFLWTGFLVTSEVKNGVAWLVWVPFKPPVFLQASPHKFTGSGLG